MESPNRIDELASIRARVETEYRNRTPASKRLFDEAVKFLPGGGIRAAAFFFPYPFVIDKGEGCSVIDVDGNVYLDLVNNYTALIHGHAHPRIVEATSAQLRKGTAFGSPVESQTELAKALCDRIPSLEKLRFCNSGTEATMHAIRLAKAETGRPKILKMEGGYHGSHDAAEVSLWSQEGPPDAPHSVARIRRESSRVSWKTSSWLRSITWRPREASSTATPMSWPPSSSSPSWVQQV